MQTGRADFDQLVKVRTIPEEEPTFILRGKDAVAADAIRCWAALAHAAGAPEATVEQALQQADRFDAYAVKKLPDADHLSEGQAKQLEYQFSRRAWKSGERVDQLLDAARALRAGAPVGGTQALPVE